MKKGSAFQNIGQNNVYSLQGLISLAFPVAKKSFDDCIAMENSTGTLSIKKVSTQDSGSYRPISLLHSEIIPVYVATHFSGFLNS